MKRHDRPPFDPKALNGKSAAARTQLISDWWRDDGDREQLFNHWNGVVYELEGRARIQDDPAPPRNLPALQGHEKVAVLSAPADVGNALRNTHDFSVVPYTELGGGGFMLAIDPGAAPSDWHAQQRRVATDALAAFAPPPLGDAARWAVRQAALLSLRADAFDMAEFAEQAALRYLGLIFGFSERDHPLLEDAARCGYRALQYVIIGRHFATEPGTLPAAQAALARLATRTSALMDEYAQRARAPRTPVPGLACSPADHWPEGVQPWADLHMSALGKPLLRTLPDRAGDLSSTDLCNLVGGLLVGSVGNVQTAMCLMVRAWLCDPALQGPKLGEEARWIHTRMASEPPVPFLPRRTTRTVQVNGKLLQAGQDCVLVLRGGQKTPCPHAWGSDGTRPLPHDCLGRAFIMPLLEELLRTTLALPGLDVTLDALTGEVLKPERLWGMGCMRYPLRHDRGKRVVQQPLIVVMPLKSPHAENAERLRRLIRAGVPRVQWSLDASRHVHMAWFELTDDDRALALRTVYDGDLDAYLEFFALQVGDLFDELFRCLEGGPPLPVSENPEAFIATIRRYNRAPLGGYFYSAYPTTEVAHIARHPGSTP